jgi:hypothetical protein
VGRVEEKHIRSRRGEDLWLPSSFDEEEEDDVPPSFASALGEEGDNSEI